MVITLIIAFSIIHNTINVVNGFIIKELLMEINVLKFETVQILEITGIIIIIVM